jgi:hypothetical protein
VANDGSRVISPVLHLRVRPPTSREDAEVGELLMGEQQGQLLYLLGSDSDALQAGNEALDVLLDSHGEHPLAVYARLVKGINAERDFKNLTADKKLEVRSAKPEESIDLLTAVEQTSTADQGIDNITLNMAMRTAARAAARAGRPEQAAETLDRMVEIFTDKGVNPAVLRTVTEQAEATKAGLVSGGE